MMDRERLWHGLKLVGLAIALTLGWETPQPVAAAEDTAAQAAKARYATRSNRLLLAAPVDLTNCLDNRQRLIPRPRADVRAIVPEVHSGHRFSLRLASWSRINGGVYDDPAPETKRVVRVQMTFRVVFGDGEVPLLFDEDRKRYFPACAADQSNVDRPNDYPTLLMTLSEAAQTSETETSGSDTTLRNRLVQHLSQRSRPLFLGNTPDLPEGGMALPATPGNEPRLRDWVRAVFTSGRIAFLEGWPVPLTLTLDDPSSIGDLADLALEHRGAPASAPPAPVAGRPPAADTAPAAPAAGPPATPPAVVTAPKATQFVMLVPELFAGHDLTPLLREVGGRCPSDWRRIADDPRGYEIECRLPPPYEVAIGQLSPVRSEQANRIVRIDELTVHMTVPVSEDWPAALHPNGRSRVGPIPLRGFLQAGARLAMFETAPEAGETARHCVAKLDGDLSIALKGLDTPLPAPCTVKPLELPTAWTQRIKGAFFPTVDGCMEAVKEAGCLQPQDGSLPIRLNYGPGWEPVELDVSRASPDAVAAVLRPAWPYAANPVAGPADAGQPDRLELLGVSYCYDARGEHCCANGARHQEIQFLKDRLPRLPSLADAGCRTDRPLPHYAIAEFQRLTPGSLLYRFRRYWTISSIAGRPYSVPRQETIRTFPIRVDANRLPGQRDGWRIALFSNLLSCQTLEARASILDTLPFNAEAVASRQVSVPVFALVTGPDGPVSQCAEGILIPDASGTVVFSPLPYTREAAGRR